MSPRTKRSGLINGIDTELEFHIEMLVRRLIDEGVPPAEARAQAEARLGTTERVRRECTAIATDMETTPMTPSHSLSTIIQDSRYALRVLWRTKVFTATSLVTLALGIGATTAIFSVVNAVLLRPLPYPAADRTALIFDGYQKQTGVEENPLSTPEFADLLARTRVFDAMAGLRPQDSALTNDCGNAACEPIKVKAYVVSPNLFDLLGVAPARGRGFTTEDGVAGNVGGDRVVMLSDALWRTRYGADPSVIGRTISLGNTARTVVGVMPPGVRFPDDPVSYMKDPADLWIPMAWDQRNDERGNQYLTVLGRMRDNATHTQVAAELSTISDGFRAAFPDRYTPASRWALAYKPLREEMVGNVKTALTVLFGAVGCVLLIACANVANLLLARGATRRRELAVRAALGADRRRLMQQLLVETLMLTGIGAALGIGVAFSALKVLIAINPGGIPRIATASIDLGVLSFAFGLALLSGLVVGVLPALREAKADPQAALGDGARGTDVSAPRRRLRGALVVGEVAVAAVVLVGALLLIRSFIAMSRVPTGVSLDDVAIAQVTIPRATYNTPDKVTAFHRALTERLRTLPGVTRAAAVYPLPLSNEGWSGSLSIMGIPEGPGLPVPHAEFGVATPGYFTTAGIPLIEGRDFADTDTLATDRVVIVDEEFARKYFPGESAVGKRVATSGDLVAGPIQTIVGVVGHVRNKGARGDSEGQLYMAALQKTEVSLFYLTRTSGSARTLLTGMRSELKSLDASLPITLLTTGRDLVHAFTAADRFNVLLFSVFGMVALALAAIGLYGVLAFLVTQRRREIGIRMALGGGSSSIVRSVITEGLALTIAGLTIGLGAAFLLASTMKSLLFSIEPTDGATYLLVVAVMIAVAVLAALAPARRATKVDPVEVLRG